MLSDNHPNYPQQQDGQVIARGNGALWGRLFGCLQRDFRVGRRRKFNGWLFVDLKHLEVASGVACLILLYLIFRLFFALPFFGKRRVVFELHFKLGRRFINGLEQDSIVLLPIAGPINRLHFHFLLFFFLTLRGQNFVFRFSSDDPLGLLVQKVLVDLFKITKDDCTVLEAIRFAFVIGQNLKNFRPHFSICATFDHPHKLCALCLIIDLHIAGKFLETYPRRRELQEEMREGGASEGKGALQTENLGLHLRYYYIDTS